MKKRMVTISEERFVELYKLADETERICSECKAEHTAEEFQALREEVQRLREERNKLLDEVRRLVLKEEMRENEISAVRGAEGSVT